jgi:Tfp pilus assembly protein PilV
MIRLKSKGETIVEVIISIAVVSSVLSGAYYLMNRSSRQSQAAVERVAASKAAESKVESLRNLSNLELAKIQNSPGKSCLTASGVSDYSATNLNCFIDRYEVTIAKNGANYEVTAVWDGLIFNKESVTIYYRP